jgi:hypothetical protein
LRGSRYGTKPIIQAEAKDDRSELRSFQARVFIGVGEFYLWNAQLFNNFELHGLGRVAILRKSQVSAALAER